MINNSNTTSEQKNIYPFLAPHLEKEPYIRDVLNEITWRQKIYLQTGDGNLPTLKELKESKTLKIPFTELRNKKIAHIIDSVFEEHSDHLRKIKSYSFSVRPETKKMTIDEKAELTLDMDNQIFYSLVEERNRKTRQNFLSFLKTVRTFNLSKLTRANEDWIYLISILKEENNKNLYIYNVLSVGKTNDEITDEYCFHRDNMDEVKKSLDMEGMKKIISCHASSIMNTLKPIGIMNLNVSDYRDPKMDYILNVLTNNMSQFIDKKSYMEVRNFISLRQCLLNAVRNMDPMKLYSKELSSYIRKNSPCRKTEITSVFRDLDSATLDKWSPKEMHESHIIRYTAPDGTCFYIDCLSLLRTAEARLNRLESFTADKYNFNFTDQKKLISDVEFCIEAGKAALGEKTPPSLIFGTAAKAEEMKNFISRYSQHRQESMASAPSGTETKKKKVRFGKLRKFISFIKNFFRLHSVKEEKTEDSSFYRTWGKSPSVRFSKAARDVYALIKEKRSPVIPLSDVIDLTKQNSREIDSIIEGLRASELKIVIPIYNARTLLYPVKSQNYIISDVEYLLLPAGITESIESIRHFTDSLSGFKLKDETLPVKGIIAIENYLMTMHRHSSKKKKKKHAAKAVK